MRLSDFFITEVSYSASTSVSMGNASRPQSSQSLKGKLKSTEDILRTVAATERDPKLLQLVNKFLVDITPYLG